MGKNREYHTYIGKWNGVPLTVCSHGIGGGGASCAFEELIQAGRIILYDNMPFLTALKVQPLSSVQELQVLLILALRKVPWSLLLVSNKREWEL